MRRLDLGLRQADAASMIGVHHGTLTTWELGHREVDTRHLPGVVRFLGYDPRPCPLSPGGRVRWLRESLGLSLKGLGRVLGVDEESVARCERGERIGAELASLFEAFREHCEAGQPLPTLELPVRRRKAPNTPPEKLLTLGDHLRRVRLDRKLSVTEAATALGCSTSSVLNWELGRLAVSIRKVPAVVAFLGYDPFKAPDTLPEVLLSIRRTRGITQAELALEIGVSASTVRGWESGAEPTGRCGLMLGQFLDRVARVLES